jgi:3-oxoadipate enol-lactonase
VLGGVSMGGYVALAYVRRFGTRALSGLVLANTRADADAPEARGAREEALRVLEAEGVEGLARRQLPRMLAEPADEALQERVRAMMLAQPKETVAAAVRMLRDRPDSTGVLGAIDVPTLVLCGDGDLPSPPAVMRAMADRIPGASYVELERCGHLANLQRPGAFDAALFGFVQSLG